MIEADKGTAGAAHWGIEGHLENNRGRPLATERFAQLTSVSRRQPNGGGTLCRAYGQQGKKSEDPQNMARELSGREALSDLDRFVIQTF